MRSPFIGLVPYRLEPGRVTRWQQGGLAVPEAYVDAVRRAGGRPVVLPLPEQDPAGTLDPFDAVLLLGGGDVAPERYDGQPHPTVYGVNEDRDEAELGYLAAALDRALPVLAICRGVQVLNVALGGTLHPHLPDVP